MNKLFYILCLVLFSATAVSQNVEFDKQNFFNKDLYKIAAKNLKSGNKYFYSKNPDYTKAKDYYLNAQKINPDNAMLNYKLGKCFYYEKKENAKEYFLHADHLWHDLMHDSLVVAESSFMLADIYMSEMVFDSAIYFYRKAAIYDYTKSLKRIADKQIKQCINGDVFLKNPEKVFIDLLPDGVNTNHDDCNPILISRGAKMVFNSYYIDDSKLRNNVSVVDISKNGTYLKTYDVKIFNKMKGGDLLCDISNDGRFCIIARDGDLYISTIDEESQKMSKPKKLPSPINTKADESFACFNKNMHYLYFVSDRKGGIGGKDIYRVSFIINKDDEFRFADIVDNMGKGVNSKFDEISVSMLPFDNGMYICSDREDAMGGFDVFLSLPDGQNWTEPKNIGYPINTPDDEIFYRPIRDSKNGYLTRRVDYANANIYKVEFLDFENEMIIKNFDDELMNLTPHNELRMLGYESELIVDEYAMASISGQFVDYQTGKPIALNVKIYDKVSRRIKGSFFTNPNSGKYRISLPSGSDYYLVVSGNKDYPLCQLDFVIPGSLTPQFYEINVTMDNIEDDKLIDVADLVLTHDDTVIDGNESYPAVHRIASMMMDYKTLTLEVFGKYDIAEQFVDLLEKSGVKRQRMTIVDYDDTSAPIFIKIVK